MNTLQAESFKKQVKDRYLVSVRGLWLRLPLGLTLLLVWSGASWQWNRTSSIAFSHTTLPTLNQSAVNLVASNRVGDLHQDESAAQDEQSDQAAQEFSAEDIQFFETKVRPILVERCGECHGADSAMEAGLSTASRATLLVGGDTGPAIVPGKPAESLLLDAVSYEGVYEMPPDSKLPDSEIATLHEWVKRGAPWPPEHTESLATELATFDLEARKAEHWCWQPIARPELPDVNQGDWVRDPIDQFILARLEQEGLSPNPPATKTEWLRRVYFDLVGLPPQKAEVQAFLEDDDERAYERVVDRLLESPRFGERWARHWMDLVRYAETCGHEFDFPIPNAWRYRDYLIRAFNEDVPYNQLIREHVAGDLLAEPRRHPDEQFDESIIGTGFWYLHEATHAPVDVRADEAGRVDNQIDVLSKTFLGLTVACARCHDHKFDAISTRDYYALAGFIQSSHRHEAVLDPGRQREHATKRLREIRSAAEQALREPFQTDRVTVEELESILTELKWNAAEPQGEGEGKGTDAEAKPSQIATSPDDPAWLLALKLELASNAANRPDHPLYALRQLVGSGEDMADRQATSEKIATTLLETQKQFEQATEESVVFADFSSPEKSDWYLTGNAFEFIPPDSITPPGPLAQPEPGIVKPGSLGSGGLSKELYGVARSKTFTITHSRIHHLMQAEQGEVRLVIDGFMMNRFSALLFSDATKGNLNTEGETKWIQQAGDIGRYLGHRAHLEFIDQGNGYLKIEQIRFSNGDPPPPQPHPWLLEHVQASPPDAKAWTSLYAHLLKRCLDTLNAPPSAANVEFVADLKQPAASSVLQLSTALASRLPNETSSNDSSLQQAKQVEEAIEPPNLITAIADGSGEDEHVFVRGNHRVMGPIAERQFLSALSDNWPSSISGSGRLELANRIADPENPLTSRVIVNRLWHHLFGVGIVPSVDNFGVLGKEPTHPRLLDYLARDFTESQHWSIKSMLKRMVLSNTYRMSSHPNAVANQIDPENRLLHRMRIRRLEGEAIRDAMLVVADQLDETMYGPSVPVYLTPFMQGRGRPGKSGPLEGANRRSIYLEVRRNFLNPMMLAFDTPIPFSTVGQRNRSNVPAQALILLNDPFVQKQAEFWAERILNSTDSTNEERIQSMYEQAFLRKASDDEMSGALRFLERQSQLYSDQLGTSEIEIEESERLRLTSTATSLTSDRAIDRRAWSDLAHVLFNVKEFIYLK